MTVFLKGNNLMTMSRRAAIGLAAAAIVPVTAVGLPFVGLKFELYRDNRSNFRWRLRARNGKLIASSGEGYKAKAACQRAIDLIMKEASSATIEDAS